MKPPLLVLCATDLSEDADLAELLEEMDREERVEVMSALSHEDAAEVLAAFTGSEFFPGVTLTDDDAFALLAAAADHRDARCRAGVEQPRIDGIAEHLPDQPLRDLEHTAPGVVLAGRARAMTTLNNNDLIRKFYLGL